MLISMLLAPFLPRIAERINKRITASDFHSAVCRYFQDRVQHGPTRDHVLICSSVMAASIWRACSIPRASVLLPSTMIPERVRGAISWHWWQCRISAKRGFRRARRREAPDRFCGGRRRARALVVSFADVEGGVEDCRHRRSIRADLPIVVRTTDENRSKAARRQLLRWCRKLLEGSLMLASHSLCCSAHRCQKVLPPHPARCVRNATACFRASTAASDGNERDDARLLHTVHLGNGANAVGSHMGRSSGGLPRWRRRVTQVRRGGGAAARPADEFVFENGDAIGTAGHAARR